MPTEVKAVQCHNCKKLLDVTGEYVICDVLTIRAKREDSASQYHKDKAPFVNLKDVAFCDFECAAATIRPLDR